MRVLPLSLLLSRIRLFIAVLLAVVAGSAQAGPEILGWLEVGYLQPMGLKIKTKLDTGARTSSIHAVNIEHFEREGADWVRFTVQSEIGGKVGEASLERPVVGEVRIKQHGEPSSKRSVVELGVCLSGRQYKGAFTLANRSQFNYEMLIGRNMLKNHIIVDPGATFTASGGCRQAGVPQATTKTTEKPD